MRSRHSGFAIYMTEFDSGKTERVSRAQTDLLVREIKVCKQIIYGTSRIHHIFMYTIIIFYIVIPLF